ncbi:hypothetical protein ACGFZL_11630 [Streptomyces sp. NPDC048182]|uniref:hypothetical protein n=1 Tax=Streptomyces sp. NPDC048182 TaxID=3365507 RepID=UPI0037187404
MVDDIAFAVGCVLTAAGCCSVLAGWTPPWLRNVTRPRLFGVWSLCLGLFCVTQLPVLRDGLVRLGASGVDARIALLLVSATALLLAHGRTRGFR